MSVHVNASKNGRNRAYVRRSPVVLSIVEWNDLQDALAVLHTEAVRRGREEPFDDHESEARLEGAKALIHTEILDNAVVVTKHGPGGRRLVLRPSATAYFKVARHAEESYARSR